MDLKQLLDGKPFQFKQVPGVFCVGKNNDNYNIHKQVKENFVYIEKIKEIGNMCIEFHSLSPVFETTFLYIQFIREVK